jgi:hypothetical protein
VFWGKKIKDSDDNQFREIIRDVDYLQTVLLIKNELERFLGEVEDFLKDENLVMTITEALKRKKIQKLLEEKIYDIDYYTQRLNDKYAGLKLEITQGGNIIRVVKGDMEYTARANDNHRALDAFTALQKWLDL